MSLFNKVIELENKANEFGFCWGNASNIVEQIRSEVEEVNEHLQSEVTDHCALQMELGDLLHAVLSLCVYLKCDPEETLNISLVKLEKRLTEVMALANEAGLATLKGKTFEELMAFWREAKVRAG